MKVNEIKKELDKHGIKYTEDMKKAELEDLLKQEEELQEEDKKYVVVHEFKDLEDSGRVYQKDDPYPKNPHLKLTEERIEELTTKNNKIGKVVIKEQD